ncbi:serine/threonine protein kinase [Micromonospora violae]|uniref:non-specific serine/threonine protein kinase n=1 Tax=Micromonospora violae TaxID=1278207 RepID=A0A4Q7UJ73_9ACTN|nr:serine/threonine-protein kinase [Micromonospora violae]RZT80964.1 serine/threonine protein kinase [Micromonospora violae]
MTQRTCEGFLSEFEAESGRIYHYDESDRVGDPGSYGTVYRGTTDDTRSVAVKVVKFRAGSPADRALAEREVEVWRQLPTESDGHLVPLLDLARGTNELIFVMPLARRNLAELIGQRAPLATPEAIDILRHLAKGMRELAAAGVVHRDIKPPNILEIDGRWHLADFGISRAMAAATASHTFRGGGTLEYRAPELFSIGTVERVASDLYALGCVGYELVTGEKAFPGPDFRHQHLTVAPTLPASVDASLRALILDLLSKEPASRPPDARRVVDALTPRPMTADWQIGVQRMRAFGAELRMENETRINAIRVHHEQQQHARQALQYLWNSVVSTLTDFDPEVTTGEEGSRGYPYFIVGDFRLMLTLEEPKSPLTPLLLVGSLVAMREGDFGAGVSPANLVCVWQDDAPRWIIVRFATVHTSMSRMGGVGAPPSSISWDGSNFTAPDRFQIMKEVATPDLILDMFNAAIGL